MCVGGSAPWDVIVSWCSSRCYWQLLSSQKSVSVCYPQTGCYCFWLRQSSVYIWFYLWKVFLFCLFVFFCLFVWIPCYQGDDQQTGHPQSVFAFGLLKRCWSRDPDCTRGNEGAIRRVRPAPLYLALGTPMDVKNDAEQSERCMLGDVVFLFNPRRGRRVNRRKLKNSKHARSVHSGFCVISSTRSTLICFFFFPCTGSPTRKRSLCGLLR